MATVTVSSVEEAMDVIQNHEVTDNHRYSAYQNSKGFGSTPLCSAKRVLWKDKRSVTVGRQGFTGIPFVILGRKRLDCHFGKDRHAKSKKKRREAKMDETDHTYKRDKKILVQDTKKMGCAASCVLREIARFPQYNKIEEGATASMRKRYADELMYRIQSGESVEVERVIVTCTPDPNEHTCRTSDAFPIEPLDRRIIQKIADLCADGIIGLKEVRTHIRTFVREICDPLPHPDNSRFYPSDKIISNHIYDSKKGKCKDDKRNLEKLVNDCRKDNPNDYYYLRLKTDQCHSDDTCTEREELCFEENVLIRSVCAWPSNMEYIEDDLYNCIISQNCGGLTKFLNQGLSPNHAFRSPDRPGRVGRTLLDVAILEGAGDIGSVLVKKRCDVNLTYIVNINNFSYQLEEYVKKDRLKLTSMYHCIVKANLPMIKLLVNGGFDVNVYDDRGCTAVWHAVDLNNYAMLKILATAKNIDVNKTDNAKLAPLHVAAMKGNVKMTSLLIQRGANVDAVQLRGSTALILACRAADYATVRILLLNGADPNHVGYNGHNVISTALQSTTDIRIPEMLICCGALVDLELVDLLRKEGKKFILLKEHPEFFKVLKECSESPRSMKTSCCLTIRRLLVQSQCKLHLIKKVEHLPLPRLIKDYLLFGYL